MTIEYSQIVELVNTDPYIQKLLAQPIPMRLAYVGLDGHPRSVPLVYLWNGKAFIFSSPPTAYKIRSIAAHPEVAFTVDSNDFPPVIMLVRGTASIEFRQGMTEEFIQAARRTVGEELFEEWAAERRAGNADMAVITIVPTHVTVCDFVDRFPPVVYEGNRPPTEASLDLSRG